MQFDSIISIIVDAKVQHLAVQCVSRIEMGNIDYYLPTSLVPTLNPILCVTLLLLELPQRIVMTCRLRSIKLL